MLAAHGITAHETPFAHEGYSGATMARVEQDGQRYVIKRASRTADWIIQMTSDHTMREAQLAASDVLVPLEPDVRSPSIAAAYDGDGFAILMRDLSHCLVPSSGPVPAETFDLILERVARMHAHFWENTPPVDLGWCGVRERLLFLSEPAGERLRAAGMMEFGFASGWERFHAGAPGDVSAFVRRLHDEPAPLLSVLSAMPQTLLHNDVKTGNMAIEGTTLWLFDWALAGIGPACMDLGWLLAVNSSRLPWTLDETCERYAIHLRAALGGRLNDAAWRRQLAAAHLAGVLLFGWAKDGAELDWWCERASAAADVLAL
jgi:hypothetical protein